ncbi:MAG TPA: SLC13 family permease [Bacteriovoracaceae bacterium]|nr:SLC13 family permease [Bacteriovoracaceae bacterium]
MILGMTHDQLMFMVIMIIAVVLFISEWLRVDMVAMLIVLSLSLTGLIEVKEAFSGFSSEPAIIVAAVFILSAGLSFTGVTDVIGEWVTKLSGKGEVRAIAVIMLSVAAMSAFTHHLMVTAMMLPIIMKICKDEKDLHASRLLIPMATAASLGTTLTLIGAPAFLLANNILKRGGGKGLSLFEVGKVGVPLVLAGVIFCVLMKWLLPKTSGEDDTVNNFRLSEITTEVTLTDKSIWIGKTFKELAAATEKQFLILNWVRKDKTLEKKDLESILEEGDTFIVKTSADELVSMDGEGGLILKALQKFSEGKEQTISLAGEEKRILKAVISPKSEFVGRSVSQINFYRRFGVAVVGIWRKSGWVATGVADTIIHAGDIIVIWGPKEKLDGISLHRGFLMFLPFYATITKRNKSKLASFIMLASITTAATGLLPAYLAFVAGAMAMILTKCVDIEQAYSSIEVKIFVMIAGVIPMGLAMERTGVDKLLASQILKYTEGWEPFAMLMVFFWIAALLTQILSDAATTVLLAPIAVAFAKGATISPISAVICVTIGAVASFLTPIGHHGNLLILSPGNYSFSDFLKIGLPLTIILSVITCYLSLLIWNS